MSIPDRRTQDMKSDWHPYAEQWSCEEKQKFEYRRSYTIILILAALVAALWGCVVLSLPLFHDVFRFVLENAIFLAVSIAASFIMCMIIIIDVKDLRLKHKAPILAGLLIFFWGVTAAEYSSCSEIIRTAAIYMSLLIAYMPYMHYVRNENIQTEDDMMGRTLLCDESENILREFVAANPYCGMSVAVHGRWGIGKTHFVHHLLKGLSEKRRDSMEQRDVFFMGPFFVSSVDLWHCSSIDEAWNDVADGLINSLSKGEIRVNRSIKRVLGYLSKILPWSTNALFNGVMKLLESSGTSSIYAESDLVEYMQEVHPESGAVLFLDNVDRCDRKIIMSLFALMERLKRIPRLIIICCIARDEMMMNVEHSTEDDIVLQRALDKLFDLMIEIPHSTKLQEINLLYQEALRQFPDCGLLLQWAKECILEFDTPRQVKRLVPQLAMYEKCYLKRLKCLRNDGAPDEFIKNRSYAIFYMEALRLLYPITATYMGQDAGHLVNEMKKFLGNIRFYVNEPNYTNKQIKVYNYISDMLVNDLLLKSLFKMISRLRVDDLEYALGKECTYISVLERGDCELLIEKIASQPGCSPRDAINQNVGKMTRPEIEMKLYFEVWRYVVDNFANESCLKYIQICCDMDVHCGENDEMIRYISSEKSYTLLLIYNYIRMPNRNVCLIIRDILEKMSTRVFVSLFRNLFSDEKRCEAREDKLIETIRLEKYQRSLHRVYIEMLRKYVSSLCLSIQNGDLMMDLFSLSQYIPRTKTLYNEIKKCNFVKKKSDLDNIRGQLIEYSRNNSSEELINTLGNENVSGLITNFIDLIMDAVSYESKFWNFWNNADFRMKINECLDSLRRDEKKEGDNERKEKIITREKILKKLLQKFEKTFEP